MDAEQIKADITALFGDTSVSREDTLAALADIQDHVNGYVDTLEEEIAAEFEGEEGEGEDD